MSMKHIILIGFKHSGKSTIGKMLAKKFHRLFFDSDILLETIFYQQHGEQLKCREIMQTYGAEYFQTLETTVLKKLVNMTTPAVIALGGGTPMQTVNQKLIAEHTVVHLTGDANKIFARIMRNGRPAFFPDDVEPRVTFDQLWQEREQVYQQLTNIRVQNDVHLDMVVEEIYKILNE
jgi:shikimate kinase